MSGQFFIFTRQSKSGKWRLYKNESQATTSWRGDNAKISAIREERCSEDNYGKIVSFTTKEAAQQYAKQFLGTNAFDE